MVDKNINRLDLARIFLDDVKTFYSILKEQKNAADRELARINKEVEPGLGMWRRQFGYCNGLEYAVDGMKRVMRDEDD